jgi:hypothetical protein
MPYPFVRRKEFSGLAGAVDPFASLQHSGRKAYLLLQIKFFYDSIKERYLRGFAASGY